MAYDFVTVKPDRGTDCQVYSRMAELGIEDKAAVPFAVAEMLFPIAPPITEALNAVTRNGYFGYRQTESHFREAVCGWMGQKGVALSPEALAPTHGVVTALGVAVRAFSKPGDPVVIQTPVYGPFYSVVEGNGRRIVKNPLKRQNGRYEMDLEDLESRFAQTGAKLFILCSPHNPLGRVWERAELEALHEVCARHGVLVLADEIHQDILPFGAVQTPYITVDPGCFAMSAASKTFNIAGLSAAYAYAKAPGLLQTYASASVRDCGDFFNPYGMAATAAAYAGCKAWMEEMLGVVAQNIRVLEERIKAMPFIRMDRPEGTYLCWLDMRALGLKEKALLSLLASAGIEVTAGTFFGPEGEGCARFNAACPTACVSAAMDRLEAAVKAR